MKGWKTLAYGSRVTTWVKPGKVKGEALRIVNNAAHNAGSGYGLSKVAGGKATKIGDYTTPQQAAEAADRLK